MTDDVPFHLRMFMLKLEAGTVDYNSGNTFLTGHELVELGYANKARRACAADEYWEFTLSGKGRRFVELYRTFEALMSMP